MNRREFIRSGALAGAAAAMVSCGSDAGSDAATGESNSKELPRVSWRLATSWPKAIDLLQNAPLRLADNMRVMSGGRFTIEVDSATKTKAPLDVFDFVRGNQFQMGHSASYYWKGKDPATLPFTTMPFGLTAQEQGAWFWYGGGVDMMNKVYAKHGMYSFPGGNTGLQMGGWFRKPINSLADLQGLKMRIPGLAGEILARVGVSPTNIPPGELYTALERGVVDAVEWINPYLDLAMGLQKIAKYYYTGWHEPGAETQFLVNRAAFDELPEVYKSMLHVAMKESGFDMLCESMMRNIETWHDFPQTCPDVHVGPLPDDVLLELKRQSVIVNAEIAAESPEFAEVLEHQNQFLKTVAPWTAISEQNYLEVRA